MTNVFNDAGIPARLVTGETPSEARAQALRDLRAANVNVLYSDRHTIRAELALAE